MTQTPTRVYIMLVFGVLATSSAAILITYAMQDGMPSPVIAAGRLTLAALALTPFALFGRGSTSEEGNSAGLYRQELGRLVRRDLLLAVASGLLLAIHFATWIASLEYTSVLISVVMVSTGPLWVALLEFVFLRLVPRPLVLVGLIVAISGGILIGLAGENSTASGGFGMGALLALIGAVAIACYLVIGRQVRAKLSLIPYIWLVYGIAALFLLALALIDGASFAGYPLRAYAMIVLLAIAPQLIGHTSFNNALKYLSATYVSIATQMEPIGSAIAAAIIFQQFPVPAQLAGSAAVIAGVLLATLGQRQTTEAEVVDSTAEQ